MPPVAGKMSKLTELGRDRSRCKTSARHTQFNTLLTVNYPDWRARALWNKQMSGTM